MQIPKQRRITPWLPVYLALSSLATETLAQEPGATRLNHRDSYQLEEVLVTATRRVADAQTVPLGISVLTSEDLEIMGASGFADYARSVSGLSFTDGGTGGEKQTIRGVSTDIWADFNAVTALYLDEVPMTHASGGIGPPFTPDPILVDIERIEVLKGPQGTLFGASAMGGAIRIIPNAPDLAAHTASVGASATSTKRGELGYALHGMFNLPLIEDRASLRTVAYALDPGGFVDNPVNGQKDVNNREVFGGRVSGTVSLSESVALTGRISYQKRESDGFSREDLDAERQQFHPLAETIKDEWINYNLVFNLDLGWASLLSSTSWLDRDVGIQPDLSFLLPVFFGFENPMWLENTERVDEFVQEFRLVSRDAGRMKWLAGLFYQNQEQFLGQHFISPGFDALTDGLAARFVAQDILETTRQHNDREQIAFYGDISYQLTDQLELSIGARWYEFDLDYENEVRGVLFTRGQIMESTSASESGVTTRLSLSYVADQNTTLYASAAEGFRPGGINSPQGSNNPDCLEELAAEGHSGFPDSYESDELWSYELGLKARWLSGRLQLNTAIYHLDWKDMQTGRFLDCRVPIIENTGHVNTDGMELELRLQLAPGLDITIASTYTRAELDEDEPNLGGRDGDRVPGVPRHSVKVGASYYFPLLIGSEGFVHGEYQYVGKSYSDFDRSISTELQSFDITNMRIGITGDAWSAALFVNNLLDERGLLFAETGLLGESVTATRPRMIGISVTRSF